MTLNSENNPLSATESPDQSPPNVESGDQTATSVWRKITPYISIARPDHWFKNVFMLGGVVFAAFYSPEAISGFPVVTLLIGLASACVIASSSW